MWPVNWAAGGYPALMVDIAGNSAGGRTFQVRGRVVVAMGYRRL